MVGRRLVKLGAHDVAAQEYADSQTDDQEAQRGWFGRGNIGRGNTFKSGAKYLRDRKRPGTGIEVGGIEAAWVRVCKPRNFSGGNGVWYLNNEPG